MTQERHGDPVHATRLFEELLFRNPDINVNEIREEYRLVARDEARRYPFSSDVRLWGSHPMEIARCLVMRIDPESGDDIDDPMSTAERYRERGFHSEIMRQYKGLMGNPDITKALSDSGILELS